VGKINFHPGKLSLAGTATRLSTPPITENDADYMNVWQLEAILKTLGSAAN
jgi:hypothetical protein